MPVRGRGDGQVCMNWWGRGASMYELAVRGIIWFSCGFMPHPYKFLPSHKNSIFLVQLLSNLVSRFIYLYEGIVRKHHWPVLVIEG